MTTAKLLLTAAFSRRILTAQVTNLSTKSIIAMASTNEPEFVPLYQLAKLHRKGDSFIDHKISSKIGEKLGARLRDIGVEEVEINVYEEKLRPAWNWRYMAGLLASVQDAGVRVVGAEELEKLG